MTLITIREQSPGPNGANAVVMIEGVGEYPVQVSPPFTSEEEARLEWYFEQHLRIPFLNTVRAAEAAASVTRYGEQLFQQIFRADPDLYASYKAALAGGIDQLRLAVAGSPAFHRLHWEALKDPQLPRPFALEVAMVRQGLKPQPLRALPRQAPTINILVVVARPRGPDDVGYRTISRPLVDSLRQAAVRATVTILPLGTYRALVQHLEATRDKYGPGHYHVIHFDLHGAVLDYSIVRACVLTNRFTQGNRYARTEFSPFDGERGFLFFEDEKPGRSDPVEANELAQLLLTHQVPVVVLNACQSGKAPTTGSAVAEHTRLTEDSLGARLLQAGVQLVLAMGYSVTVSAAALLMTTFYRELFAGRELAEAIRLGRLDLFHRKARRAFFDQTLELEDWMLPVVYQQAPVSLRPREFTPQEEAVFYERGQELVRMPEARYGFLGRDLDILAIERRVFATDNQGRRLGRPLLIQGMGGAGKTTLLRYLATWWQQTQGIGEVFYFGYDQRAWTHMQMLRVIAEQLLSPVEFVNTFLALPEDGQQALLVHRLQAGHHLLLLDNLNLVTGNSLSKSYTLPKEEQQKLWTFLASLVGGQTIVLLGSRSDEAWLREGGATKTPPLREGDTYLVRGLDDEAATVLAERILEVHELTARREDPELLRLLEVLDGFPLALEVTLPNLRKLPTARVLAALRAGEEAGLDSSADNQAGSLLRCVDYTHSNLDLGAQNLLLCLAPFTSVLFEPMVPIYIEHLQAQPALGGLPFKRWNAVLAEARRWGLLLPHPEQPAFLQLQPVLPYFLRNRLQAVEHQGICEAIIQAFVGLYQNLGRAWSDMMTAQDAEERNIGVGVVSLEYGNLLSALDHALSYVLPFDNIIEALDDYWDASQNHVEAITVNERVLKTLADYPTEGMQGELRSAFLLGVYDNLARHQVELRWYQAAANNYQAQLRVIELLTFPEQEQQRLVFHVHHGLGRVAQLQRQWQQAEAHFSSALSIATLLNDRDGQAGACHHLAVVAQEQGQWARAESLLHEVLVRVVELGDRYRQASTYHELGIVAQAQGQRQQAERLLRMALSLYTEFKDTVGQGRAYHHLGIIAQEQRQWTQAERHFQQAHMFWVRIGDRLRQASSFFELGRTVEMQQQLEQAADYYWQARTCWAMFHDHFHQALACYRLGLVRISQQQWAESRDSLLEALELFTACKAEEHLGDTLYNLARLAALSGDSTTATAVAESLHVSEAEAERLLIEARRPLDVLPLGCSSSPTPTRPEE